jgi:hypothetical protein
MGRRRHAAALFGFPGHAAPELHGLGVGTASVRFGQVAIEPLVDGSSRLVAGAGKRHLAIDHRTGGKGSLARVTAWLRAIAGIMCFVSVEHQAYFSSSKA